MPAPSTRAARASRCSTAWPPRRPSARSLWRQASRPRPHREPAMSDTLLASPDALLSAPRPSLDWRATLWQGHFVVLVLLGGFALWASTARLDGAAVAAGVVAVESNRKTVQHLEGGIVQAILVRD